MLVSVGLPVSANAINKDVGAHTKMSLNVKHRVVSSAGIAERTASLESGSNSSTRAGYAAATNTLIAEAPHRTRNTFPAYRSLRARVGVSGAIRFLAGNHQKQSKTRPSTGNLGSFLG